MTRSPNEPRKLLDARVPPSRLDRRLATLARQAGYALVPLEAAALNDTEDAALAAIAVAEVRRLRRALEDVRGTIAGAGKLLATGKHQRAIELSLDAAIDIAAEALSDNPAAGIIPNPPAPIAIAGDDRYRQALEEARSQIAALIDDAIDAPGEYEAVLHRIDAALR